MKQYGYIRVSTKDQNPARQWIALENAGIKRANIFVDYESGKNFNRRNYQKLMHLLKEEDVLFVKAIDRLGRNYDEIIEQWSHLTKTCKVDIVVLDCPILDTRTKTNGLTAKVITDLFLQLMSYVAQIERDNTRQRQKEGIVAARAKGVKFGRPKKEIPSDFLSVYDSWKKRTISGREAARRLKVDHSTFTKWTKEKSIKQTQRIG